MVSLLDSLSYRRATATTDVTGFYHFATTRVLTAGASYAVGGPRLPFAAATTPPQTLYIARDGDGVGFEV